MLEKYYYLNLELPIRIHRTQSTHAHDLIDLEHHRPHHIKLNTSESDSTNDDESYESYEHNIRQHRHNLNCNFQGQKYNVYGLQANDNFWKSESMKPTYSCSSLTSNKEMSKIDLEYGNNLKNVKNINDFNLDYQTYTLCDIHHCPLKQCTCCCDGQLEGHASNRSNLNKMAYKPLCACCTHPNTSNKNVHTMTMVDSDAKLKKNKCACCRTKPKRKKSKDKPPKPPRKKCNPKNRKPQSSSDVVVKQSTTSFGPTGSYNLDRDLDLEQYCQGYCWKEEIRSKLPEYKTNKNIVLTVNRNNAIKKCTCPEMNDGISTSGIERCKYYDCPRIRPKMAPFAASKYANCPCTTQNFPEIKPEVKPEVNQKVEHFSMHRQQSVNKSTSTCLCPSDVQKPEVRSVATELEPPGTRPMATQYEPKSKAENGKSTGGSSNKILLLKTQSKPVQIINCKCRLPIKLQRCIEKIYAEKGREGSDVEAREHCTCLFV